MSQHEYQRLLVHFNRLVRLRIQVSAFSLDGGGWRQTHILILIYLLDYKCVDVREFTCLLGNLWMNPSLRRVLAGFDLCSNEKQSTAVLREEEELQRFCDGNS